MFYEDTYIEICDWTKNWKFLKFKTELRKNPKIKRSEFTISRGLARLLDHSCSMSANWNFKFFDMRLSFSIIIIDPNYSEAYWLV